MTRPAVSTASATTPISAAEEIEYPAFVMTPLEKEAVAIAYQLDQKGQPEGLRFAPEKQKQINEIVLATKNGKKDALMNPLQVYIGEIIGPKEEQRVAHAVALVEAKTFPLKENPDFTLVIQTLKEAFGSTQQKKVTWPTDRESTVVMLLLALTYTPKHALSVTLHDPVTGNPRPSGFPLNENLMQGFLSGFYPEKDEVTEKMRDATMRRALYKTRAKQFVPNPAAELLRRYRLRKEQYERDKQAFIDGKALAGLPTAPKAPKEDTTSKALKEAKQLAEDLNMLLLVSEQDEQVAIIHAITPEVVRDIAKEEQTLEGAKNIEARLTALYTEKLPPRKAMALAIRMVEPMRKVSVLDRDALKTFIDIMQKNGHMPDGQEWFDRYNAGRTGYKQNPHAKGGHYVEERKLSPAEEFALREKKRKEREHARKMLGLDGETGSIAKWLEKNKGVQVAPQHTKVLDALMQEANVASLVEASGVSELWSALPTTLQLGWKEILARVTTTRDETKLSFAFVKDMFLEMLEKYLKEHPEPELEKNARDFMAKFELGFTTVVNDHIRDFGMTFAKAVEQLKLREAQKAEADRKNSLAYKNSAAAGYAKNLG